MAFSLRPRGIVVEHDSPSFCRSSVPSLREHVGPELRDDRRERRLARLDDPAGEVVGVDVHRAVLGQSPRDRGLSRGDSARETDQIHADHSIRATLDATAWEVRMLEVLTGTGLALAAG